jgi:hypothetical protein
LEEALDAAAVIASSGGQPKIFQEVVGEIRLTARLIPGETNGNGPHPVRQPVRLPDTGETSGGKRTAGDLAKLRTRILSWVTITPGKGVEAMARGLNLSTKDLVLPIRQLVTEKKILKKGQARAVKYHPAATSTRTKAEKKAA